MVDDFGMDDQARCGECGSRLEIVRPGKYQCPTCDALGVLLIDLESSALAWGAARASGYDFDTDIGTRFYTRLQMARNAVIAHATEQVKSINASLDECRQYEQSATNNAHAKAAAMKEKQDEIIRLRTDIERIGHERDQMVAANVELQERLSRLEDDLK